MSGLREYLAGQNDGPGGSAMPRRRAFPLCTNCGAPKPPGRGRRLCDECSLARNVAVCANCGERKPKANGGRYCADCRAVAIEVNAKRAQARLRMKVKVCRGGCGRSGPFRIDGGRVSPYCARCRAQRHAPTLCGRCRERPIRAPHTRLCEPCHQRAIVRKYEAKRAWEARHPEKVKETQRRSVARRVDGQRIERERQRITRSLAREARGEVLTPVESITGRIRRDADRFPALPAAPLAAAIERLIAREGAGSAHGPELVFTGETGQKVTTPHASVLEAVCARLTIAPRTLRAWITGERKALQFDLADRVLTHGDWCWWDVWHGCGRMPCSCEQCVGAEQAQIAFEGERAA